MAAKSKIVKLREKMDHLNAEFDSLKEERYEENAHLVALPPVSGLGAVAIRVRDIDLLDSLPYHGILAGLTASGKFTKSGHRNSS